MAPPAVSAAGRSRRVLRNTFSNSVGRGVSILTTLVLTPFILHSLGEAAFGLWVYATLLVSYGSLLDLGMGSAIVKYVAETRATGDRQAGHELIATATRSYALLALAALGIGAVLSSQASRLVDLGGIPEGDARAVLALVTVSFAVNLAATPSTAALRGLQRYDITNALMVLNLLASAALTVLVLRAGGGVVAMVGVTVPVSLATQLTAVLVIRRLHPDLALRWSPVARSSAKKLTRFGATLTVSQLAVLLQKRSSEIIIAAQLSVAAVAPFSLARRLSDLPHVISDQFIKVLLPVASEMHAVGDQAALRRLYLSSTRVTLSLMLPLALAACFLAGDFLELWVGADYRSYARLVVLLVAGSVAFTMQWPAGSIFQGIGRFGVFAVSGLVSGVATVALTLVLVRSHGLTGVAVGTLVPTVAESLLFVLPYALVRLHVPVRALATQVLLPVLVPTLPCVGVLLVAGAVVDRPTWAGLVTAGALAMVAYEAVYLLMPAARTERDLLTTTLRRRGVRVGRHP